MKAFDWITDEDLQRELSDTVQVLMYIHPGHPELYTKLSNRISGYPQLSESDVQAAASKFRVSAHNGMWSLSGV